MKPPALPGVISLTLRYIPIVATIAFSLSTSAQSLIWSGAGVPDTNTINIGGTTQRPTIASIVFDDRIFIAYTASNNCSGTACAIEIKETTGQEANQGFAFSSYGFLGVPTIGIVYRASNPALAVANGVAYIAWTDQSGNNWLSSSTNMLTWSSPLTIPTGPTTESITISVNPSAPNELWVGYLRANLPTDPYDPEICYVVPNGSNFPASGVSCYATNEVSYMWFNPGLIWSGNTLFLFQEYRGSSHCLSSFYSTGGLQPWTY